MCRFIECGILFSCGTKLLTFGPTFGIDRRPYGAELNFIHLAKPYYDSVITSTIIIYTQSKAIFAP